MRLEGSKTAEALQKAFAAESEAYNRYTHYAAAARKAGLEQVADIFAEIAKNELEHAEHELDFLAQVRDTRQNLEAAANGEHQEWTAGYPELERIARSEGFSEIADFFRHVATVEQRHEHMFQQLLASLDTGEPVKGKTVLHSAVDMAQVMLPQQANPAGFVHGGELMKLMDNAAGVVACRHARTNVVTANVEEIDFLQPVRVGDLLLIHAQLTFTSQSSMEVRVEVAAEDILTGRRTPSLAAHYNMVALGPEGKPARVPPLIRSTEAEERLFSEGETRYRGRKERRQHAQ